MKRRAFVRRSWSVLLVGALAFTVLRPVVPVFAQPESSPNPEPSLVQEQPGELDSKKHLSKLELQMNREEADRKDPKRENPKVLDLMRQAGSQYSEEDPVGLLLVPVMQTQTFASLTDPQAIAARAPDMSPEQALAERETVLESQNAMIESLRSSGYSIQEVGQRLTILLNAVPVRTTYATAKQIAAHESVERVFLTRAYERVGPEMVHSVNMIHAPQVWNTHHFKGEGMVVSIIDSGIDPKHEVFSKLQDPSKAKLTEEDAKRAAEAFGLPTGGDYQYYFSPKVPFGMAISQPSVVDPSPHSHGMHVAGTVAGYFDGDNRHFSGVAPEAQVIGFNVFNMLGGTSSDNYIFAMEMSYFLRADAVNMSLGKSVGTEDEIDPTVLEAIGKLEKLGTVVSISAGNDGTVGYQCGNVRADQVDYGVIADPSLVEPSLSVAALENQSITSKPIKVQYAGKDEAVSIAYKDSDNSASFVHPDPIPVVYCGLGHPEDFEGKEISGKAILVDRGVISFEEKAQNALKAVRSGQEKPVLLIVSNNVSDTASSMTMGAVHLPAVAIGQTDGRSIKEALDRKEEVRIYLPGTEETFQNPVGGEMSDFSSWGPTPNYGFKPEISAPGGRIVSSVNTDDQGVSHYEEMSGTSMSSPHVTGAVALLKQKLMQERGLSNRVGKEAEDPKHQEEMTALKHDLKNILMSTARPNERDQVMVSPRQQGAGMLDIQAAVETHAYLYDAKPLVQEPGAPRVCKINLREIQDQIQMTVGVHNFGQTPLHYQVRYTAQTDRVDSEGKITMLPEPLLKGTLQGQVEVAPGQDLQIPVAFGLQDSQVQEKLHKMPHGAHVDGFVVLEPVDPEKDGPTLSIPYIAFAGDWTKLPMTEPSIYQLKQTGVQPIYERYSDDSLYAFTHLSTRDYDEDGALKAQVLGAREGLDPTQIDYKLIDGEKIAISPNGDSSGDQAFYSAVMYRNYEIQIEVLDASGKVIWTPDLGPRTEGKKNFKYDNLVTQASFWFWGGEQGNNDNPQTVSDGRYTFRVKLTPRLDSKYFGGKTIAPEIQDYPIYVDTKRPEFESVQLEGNQLVVHFQDEGVGVMSTLFEYNNQTLISQDGTLTLPESWKGHEDEVRITLKDWAQNRTTESVGNLRDRSRSIGSIQATLEFAEGIRHRRVDLVAEDASGKRFYDLKHLPLGTYRVFNLDLPYGLQLNPQEQTVELTASQPQAQVKFEVQEEDQSMGYVFIHLKKPGAYTQAIRPYIIAAENGKKTLVPKSSGDKYSNTEHFTTRAAFGSYHLYFDNVKEGYEIYPNNLDVEVKPNQDVERNFIVTRTGEIGSIQTEIQVDSDVQITEEQKKQIQFHAVQQEEQIEIPDLSHALYGTYKITVSQLPEGVFADPGIQQVQVSADQPEARVVIRLRSSKGSASGEIVVENHPEDLSKRPPMHEGRAEFGESDNPDFHPTDQPIFAVEDSNGKRYPDGQLNNLPYGYYKIHIVRYPSGYALKESVAGSKEETLFEEVVREVVLTPEQPRVTVQYEWNCLYTYNETGAVYIRPIYNRSKMAPMFNFKITNSQGKVQTLKYANDGYFTDSLILPYDTYTIEPINLRQGVTAQPMKIEIPVCTGYQIVRFYYDADDSVKPLPSFTDGPGRVRMDMPISQYYAYNPTMAVYSREKDGTVSKEPVAKSEFHMDLLSMGASINKIPEGKYEVRVEDMGEGFRALPDHIPFEIHDNRIEREFYLAGVRIYPTYEQEIQTEGLPQGASLQYEAIAYTGDHVDPLAETDPQTGRLKDVPIGREYFIRPKQIPAGYTVEPPVIRINYMDSYDGVACAKPEAVFHFYPLEGGVNLKPLQDAMLEASHAVETESAGLPMNRLEGNDRMAISEEEGASLLDEHDSLSEPVATTTVPSASEPLPNPKPDDTVKPEEESERKTEAFFVLEDSLRSRLEADQGRVYFAEDTLRHDETIGKRILKDKPGYFVGYQEFVKLYQEIQKKIQEKAYKDQNEVRNDRARIRYAVSHLQRRDLCKQLQQVSQNTFDLANATVPKGESSVTVFVGTDALRQDQKVHWNIRLVDFAGHEFYPERDLTSKSKKYFFRGLPRGEYSCQIYNDGGYVQPVSDWVFTLTGAKDSFENLDLYLSAPLKWPIQRLLYDRKTDQETALEFDETMDHVQLHYNTNTLDSDLGKVVKGYEGSYDDIAKQIDDPSIEQEIPYLQSDFQDGKTWVNRVQPVPNCRLDFVRYLPLNDGFWVRPVNTPEGLRAVDFDFFAGVDNATNMRTLRLYYVREDDPDPSKPDPSKPDPSKPDPSKPDPSKPDPSKPDPSKPDPSKPDPSKPDPSKPDPSKPDPSKPDPSKPDPSKPDPSKPDPSKPDPSKPDPSKPDPSKSNPTNPKPSQPDSGKTDPNHPGSGSSGNLSPFFPHPSQSHSSGQSGNGKASSQTLQIPATGEQREWSAWIWGGILVTAATLLLVARRCSIRRKLNR